MGRALRIIVPNLPFHVLNRGNNRQLVFKDSEDFKYYLGLLIKYKKEFGFKLYHFILMPNHAHFLLEPTAEGSLPKFMQKITLAHTRYFNKKYQSIGHVWQGRYKSSLIDKEDYFIWCGLYIELNSVRARLAVLPEDWRWSSYNFYAFGKIDSLTENLIDVDPYYLKLGSTSQERQNRYREVVKEIIKEDSLKRIRKNLDGGVFGSDDFAKKIKEKFEGAFLGLRGRPRKEEKWT